ncbi:SGNH/GDSL hydrolase family protein [bacterium]|nr:SGNH/GDSL hydrolase family protein [bacterium]
MLVKVAVTRETPNRDAEPELLATSSPPAREPYGRFSLMFAPGVAFLFVAAALFFAADFLLTHVVALRIDAGDFRVPRSSVAGIDDLLDAAAGAAGPKIVMLGDSVVRGDHVEPQNALPPRIARALATRPKRARVFNLGLSAANNSDKLLVLERLLARGGTPPDLVVIEENLKFYTSEYRLQSARYPRLVTPDMRRTRPNRYARVLELPAPRRDALWSGAEYAAGRAAERLTIARHRDGIAEWLGAGDHPARRALAVWNVVKRRIRYGESGPQTKSPRSERGDGVRGRPLPGIAAFFSPPSEAVTLNPAPPDLVLDVPEQNLRDGVNIRALEMIGKLCREREIACLVYLTPMNPSAVVSGRTMSSYRVRTRTAAGANVGFIDLTTLLPASEFRDLDHPRADGMDALAERLAAEIEARL